MTRGIKMAITPQLDPDPKAVTAATRKTTAGRIFMGIVSPRVVIIKSAVCRSRDRSARAQASIRTSMPITINLSPLYQASNVSFRLRIR
jgi:hypothetical protein